MLKRTAPVHASIREDSPFFDPRGHEITLTVDGRRPAFAFEYNTSEGWVKVDRYGGGPTWLDEGSWKSSELGEKISEDILRGNVEARYT